MGLCGCGLSNKEENNKVSGTIEESQEELVLDESTAEMIAAQALYEKIQTFCAAYNAYADNTQYRITSTMHFDGFYMVEGVYTLYRSNGTPVGMKKNEAFAVKVYNSGSAEVTKCGY